jgi:CHAD domain-containing protein
LHQTDEETITMTFRIKGGESVEQGVQRIAREQIDKSTGETRDQDLDRHEAVHQVRKRCKKIRGLIRLVRPQFEDTYVRENAWYRDSARRLSYVRDAQSIIETFDKLVEHYEDKIDRDAFVSIRLQLTKRRNKVAEDEVGLREQLAEFLDRMNEGRERVAAWSLHDDGFDAIKGGLMKTYARGRAAMVMAYAKPSTESFHEWRKRAKYHWYHMRLISAIWEKPMNARRDEADLVSDYLGDDHDLSILRQTLLRRPDQFGGEDLIQAMIGLIAQRQVELRTRAKSLGARIFAERPKLLAERLGRYWQVWAGEGEVDPQATHTPKLITV